MLMHEVQFPDGTPIDGYGPGTFRIGGFVHRGGLLILPGRIGQWTPAEPPVIEDFAAVIAAGRGIDVLLVGLGADIGIFPRAVRAAIEAAGPGVDVMATPAACRTFNVLLAENRRVAAALLPITG
jgi:uncharacterized protein